MSRRNGTSRLTSTDRARSASASRARLQGAFGGALVALSSVAGMLIGARSIASVELPGVRSLLSVPPVPSVDLGVEWSHSAVWPAQLQDAALERMAGILLTLLLAAVAVAVLNALVLLAEAGASRRREMAVRAALGANPRRLLRHMVRDIRVLFMASLGLGMVLGVALGGALRASWPGTLASVGLLSAAGSIVVPLLAVAGLSSLGYVAVGWRVGSGKGLARALTSGARVTDDGRAVALRRALSAFQMAVAGSVLCGTVALARIGVTPTPRPEGHAASSGRRSQAPEEAATAAVVSVRVPGGAGTHAWDAMLARLGRVPGLEAESLATPGALEGLGVRDDALAQCGQCVRGEFVLPLLSAVPAHHAVGPGFFAATGWKLEEGREFTSADGAGAPLVAIVNRAFANSSFENGRPLGHQIRIGTDPNAWYTVVGVVANATPPALGSGTRAPDAVYLSALQRPPAFADIVLRGRADPVRTAVGVLAAAGWAPGPVSTVRGRLEQAAAPLRWVALVSLGLAVLVLMLAMHGMHVTARQVTRRREHELAVRRVLGASDARVLRHALAGTLRSAAWGVYGSLLGGTLLVALLEKTSAGVTMMPPGAFVSIAALLAATALVASATAARDQLRVEPGSIVE